MNLSNLGEGWTRVEKKISKKWKVNESKTKLQRSNRVVTKDIDFILKKKPKDSEFRVDETDFPSLGVSIKKKPTWNKSLDINKLKNITLENNDDKQVKKSLEKNEHTFSDKFNREIINEYEMQRCDDIHQAYKKLENWDGSIPTFDDFFKATYEAYDYSHEDKPKFYEDYSESNSSDNEAEAEDYDTW
jgi:hypothetical protein